MPVLFFSNSGLQGDLLFSLFSQSILLSWEKESIGKQRHCLQHYEAIIIDCWKIGIPSQSQEFLSELKKIKHPKSFLINFPADMPTSVMERLRQSGFYLLCDSNTCQENLIHKLNTAIHSCESRQNHSNPNIRPLTRREQEILEQLTTGEPNSAIATKLHLSEHTVKNHMYNIFRKIGVKNRIQASNWAKINLQEEKI
ncbi:helix-turn-helix transcriptional regulator [Microbulbifer sp. A4B17]|uniref:helix-turn-helix transcriptional regulator n=1 Tax=Microbulbifer sp. A4B17 TaxID=359370 RepID=UPI000D52D6DB|nr:response regulator transcription factor [Microbulbifer sp. A4B17]AWF82610.1 helix-turn-helix transcriptional regulator [Microbulbifer sp. A4B17]